MKTKTAFITGVTGQDGAWLAQLLLQKGYRVYGGARRTSRKNLYSLEFLGIADQVELVEFELTEYSNMYEVLKKIKPDEFYNLAAQSFVATSFEQPIMTSLVNGIAVANILDILKTVSPRTKFYQASTSEMFGKVREVPQNEETPFYPRSPYGIAKLYAHWMTINYRESYGMFCVSGILFNHESELRGPEFVTRKITMHVARKAQGSKKVLELGNLDACRDWGYAKEYVVGMYKMMQAKKPDTYVLATGKTTKIRDFVKAAYKAIGIDVAWKGKGLAEKGYDRKSGELLIKVNPKFYRPAEVEYLRGDAGKAARKLKWVPKVNTQRLAKIMVRNDIKILRAHAKTS
jgi:GDPmannose 4,6-dehydratase